MLFKVEKNDLYPIIHQLRTRFDLLNLFMEGKTLREAASILETDESTISKALTDLVDSRIVRVIDQETRKKEGIPLDLPKYMVFHYPISLAYSYSIKLWGKKHYDKDMPENPKRLNTDNGTYWISMEILEYVERCLKFISHPAMLLTFKMAREGKESVRIQKAVCKHHGLHDTTVRGYLKELVDLGLFDKVKKGRGSYFEENHDLCELLFHPFLKKSAI